MGEQPIFLVVLLLHVVVVFVLARPTRQGPVLSK